MSARKDQYFIDIFGKAHNFKGSLKDVVSIHYEIAKQLYPNVKNPDDFVMDSLGWVI